MNAYLRLVLGLTILCTVAAAANSDTVGGTRSVLEMLPHLAQQTGKQVIAHDINALRNTRIAVSSSDRSLRTVDAIEQFFDACNREGLTVVEMEDTIVVVGLEARTAGRGCCHVRVSVAPCAGDFDDNGDIGFADLTSLLLYWGPCPPISRWDLDASGSVGFDDLTALLTAWGPCT